MTVAEDLTRYANDPVGFLTDVLGDAGAPYSKQAEILEALVDHRRVTVVGANGSGKDWAAGRVVVWWEETHPEGKAIVMGPTQRQVEEIIWPEMSEAYAAAEGRLSGRIFKSAYRIDEKRFALGFSTNKACNIQGFHSEELLVVVTEAHAMPQAHMDAIKRLQPNRLLLVGNALSRDGEFYDSHHAKRHLYRRIAISAFDTPNFTGEDGGRRGMITPQDVEEYALDYGKDHPLYAASVLAQFPDTLDDSLIGRDAVESAMERGETRRAEASSVVPAEDACHSERSAAEPRACPEPAEGNLSGTDPAVYEGSPRDVSASLNMTNQEGAVVPAEDACHFEQSAAEPRACPEPVEGNLSGARPAVDEHSPRDVSTSPPAPLNMTNQEGAVVPAEHACHSERSAAEPRACPEPVEGNLSDARPAVDERSPKDASASLNMTNQEGAVVPAEIACHSERSAAEPRACPEPVEGNLSGAPLPPHDPNAPVYLGVDVARFGFDKSAICVRQDERVLSVRSFERMDTMRLVYEVLGTVQETGATAVFVDEGGVGGGVVDRLRELGAPVYGVHFGGASHQSRRFFNRRSEIFWELRRLLNGQLMTLPRDEELAGQLLSLRYDVSSSGQVRLEGKREMRKRGMPSPDRADALALAFMTPPSFGIWTGAEPFLRDDSPPPEPTIDALGYDHPPPHSFGVW